MKKSLLKKLPVLIFSILLFIIFYDSNDRILENKLNSNNELLKKYQEFKNKGIEKDISFPKALIESVIDTAKTYIGTLNKIGGISHDSIDASGLIHISLKKNGITEFPRIAQEMARYGKIITEIEDLEKGDLVFYFDTYKTERLVTSVGIYLGDNKFISSTSKKGVSIDQIDNPSFKDNYWINHFFYGTRIFE
tara:strand:+ start:467 stop:1045 length:579 start_codon:yes stop_codon:yes gene_type:complete